MKFRKIALCTVAALGVGASSAMADVRYDRVVGSCDDGTPGVAAIAFGMASLRAPDQMAWAQIRAYPKGLKLSEIEHLSFASNASDPGVVYLKMTFQGQRSILFSPSTQAGGEQGVGTWATHDVVAGTVRLDDDAGMMPDITWSQMVALAGDAQIKDVRVTAGCASPVDSDGALVRVDDLTINDEVLDFGP
jgi:hypothetical protein